MRASKSFITALGIGLAAAALLTACSGATTAPPQRTATLSRGSLLASVNASGNIQAAAEAKLAFQSGGIVAQVNVTEGDAVKKGDVLAVLDTAEADFALRKAQASLKDADAALVIAQSSYSRTLDGPRPTEIAAARMALKAANDNYQKVMSGPTDAEHQSAKARLANAEAEVRRAQSAYDDAHRQDPAGIGAHPAALELEKATNNYNAARADYDKAMQPADESQKSAALRQIADARAQLDKVRQPARSYDIERAKAEVQQAQNRIEQAKLDIEQAQHKLDRSKIVAAFDGVVSTVDVKVGETADTQPVITLVDVSHLRIDINVDEVDVAKVKVGQAASVRLDALPGLELQGKVDRISPTSKVVNGVVTYAVQVALPPGEAQLKPGMTANTNIVLEQRQNVVLAPNWAIRKDKKTGKSYITVPDGQPNENKTKEIEVVLGLKDDSAAEVISGAGEGQLVVQPAQNTNPLAQ